MLAPGTGKTATARLSAYRRTNGDGMATPPPASWYRFSSDREGQHPKDHLTVYQASIHAYGYTGFENLYCFGDIQEVACMTYVRGRFIDVHRTQGSTIGEEAIQRKTDLR